MPPTRSAPSHNAFAADFLRRLDRLPEPEGAHEAWTAGPWTVTPVGYLGASGFALLRQGESLAAGDQPYAVFRRRQTALLAAAVLPGSGRDPLFRLQTDPEPAGFALRTHDTATPGDITPAGSPQPALPAPPAPPNATTHPDPAPVAGHRPPQPPAAGHLRDFDEDFVAALHVAAMLARSPAALAYLLEAAGAVCLEQAGKLLDHRLQ